MYVWVFSPTSSNPLETFDLNNLFINLDEGYRVNFIELDALPSSITYTLSGSVAGIAGSWLVQNSSEGNNTDEEYGCVGSPVEGVACSTFNNQGDCEVGTCTASNGQYAPSCDLQYKSQCDADEAQYCAGPGCGTATPPACIGNGGFCQSVSEKDCSPWNTNPTGCGSAYGGNKCVWRGGYCWPEDCLWNGCSWALINSTTTGYQSRDLVQQGMIQNV
jgi:hypothetical protein